MIPQREPFVLVDTLESVTATAFTSTFMVPDAHVLVADGQLSEAGLMENVAQTAALGIGWQARTAGAPAPLGFIGSIDRVMIHDLPPTGTLLTTTVLVKHQVANVHVIEGSIRCAERIFATMEMKVVMVDESTTPSTQG